MLSRLTRAFFEGGDLATFDEDAVFETELTPKAADHCGAFAATTEIRTPIGIRRVEELAIGDCVLTCDHGFRPVTGLVRGQLWTTQEVCPPDRWPLLVPTGLFGNVHPARLLPEQLVLFEEEEACDLFGSFSVAIPARLLEGYFGIERERPRKRVPTVSLYFERDEIVVTHGGLLVPRAPFSTNGELLTTDWSSVGSSDEGALADFLELGPQRAFVFLQSLMTSGKTRFRYVHEIDEVPGGPAFT